MVVSRPGQLIADKFINIVNRGKSSYVVSLRVNESRSVEFIVVRIPNCLDACRTIVFYNNFIDS